MNTYKIIRFYERRGGIDPRAERTEIKRGLTLEQAQAHCTDPETSSSTGTTTKAQQHTAQHGPWFDGYTEEK